MRAGTGIKGSLLISYLHSAVRWSQRRTVGLPLTWLSDPDLISGTMSTSVISLGLFRLQDFRFRHHFLFPSPLIFTVVCPHIVRCHLTTSLIL